MNGIHDMGGMDGFGPVVAEQNEPVFHAEWERRLYAMISAAIFRIPGMSADEFRHAIERIPPARYLSSSYYERWLAAAEELLVERGLITRQELLTANGASADSVIANLPAAVAPELSKRAARMRARFKVGDRVRAREINPPGHTRLPRYARGKLGTIARDWGVFVFADSNAHRVGENRQHCYAVKFDAHELWGKAARARERVNIDLWEDYLEAAPKSSKPKRGRR
ncbi:MAG TPA: nitrile hydratase subunit beta [Candidatus Binataceae bacterium]|nr:nitrile hydratase subunit beta [Candidatus Binataceae bacterium]